MDQQKSLKLIEAPHFVYEQSCHVHGEKTEIANSDALAPWQQDARGLNRKCESQLGLLEEFQES